MDTQTTTWSKAIQVLALVFVLVAVSACSKKEKGGASVRNRGVSRNQGYTPTGNQPPGTTYSQYGTISTSQQAVQNFVYSNDSSFQLGQVQSVLFTGRVSDGYSMQAGGSMSLIIRDSFGEAQADYGCEMQVQGNRVTVYCENSQGQVTFDGNATNSTYTGQVYYNGSNVLGNFSISTCNFLDAGC